MDLEVMEVRGKSGYGAALLSDEQFEFFWPEIERLMDQIPHTWEDLTKDSIIQRALDHTLQVWGVGDKAIELIFFSQVATYPSGKVLQIIWAAGAGRVYDRAGDEVDSMIEFFARSQGCKRIDVIGRPGWEKVLEKRGFKKGTVILSRPVGNGHLQ